MFEGKPYVIRNKGNSVYVEWLKSIDRWNEKQLTMYNSELVQAVRRSVSSEVWPIISNEQRMESDDYHAYVNSLKEDLITEYNMKSREQDGRLGYYHGDQYIISFPAQEGIRYPRYFGGIQLRPLTKQA